MPEFRFPTLKKIQLTAFSLFSQHPNIELEIDDGVLCLAGANGIGKSTFLAAVNFAITGCVPHPDRKFQSAAEYLRDAEKFSEDFFEGRIDEQDRDQASISVDFKLGGTIFSLTRGIFEGAGTFSKRH